MLTCLQIHNDYQIPGGETKTAIGIARLLESNGINVIQYYKDNKSFAECGTAKKILIGFRSLYNSETIKELSSILKKEHVDFALIHNTMPLISNSVYKVLHDNNIPIIKYIQNYNLICLNGAIDHGDSCVNCKRSCFNGVKNRCYKNNLLYSIIRYFSKNELQSKYLPLISALMPNSEYVKLKHSEYGIDPQKMHVMYNYVDSVECIEDLGNYNNYYLYFGRISREKGIFTCLSAFKKNLNLHLVIMGSGECENELKESIEGFQNIEFIGNKNGKALLEVIKKSKCVIVPSEWDEPLPRTILEAYSLGIPVIGALSGGIPEMIKDGIGLGYESGNEEELNKALLIFDSFSEKEYFQMRINSLEECKRMFSRESYWDRFRNVLISIGVLQ